MITKIISHRKFTYKVIQWELLNYCNYNCYYCGLHDNSEICTNYKDIVEYLNKNIPNSIFPTIPQLFGGEPTLHPYFWDICDSLKVPFGIYTNLSQDLCFWKKFSKITNLHHIYCTYHNNSVTNTDDFIKKVDYLIDTVKEFTLNIMLENTGEEILNLHNKYKDKITCVLTKVHNSTSPITVTPSMIHPRQYFDIINGGKVITLNSFHYDTIDEVCTRNFKCSTIKYFNNIDVKGNISNYCRRNVITSVYEDNYSKINRNFILCSHNTCPKYCYVIGEKQKL